MKNLEMFCLAIDNSVLEKINSLNYTPVGLGERKYSAKCLRDNTGENISYKNEYYGEYTFHYWLWKNNLINIPDEKWIGFCAYRRFWAQRKNTKTLIKKNNFLHKIPKEWEGYEAILGQNIYIDNWSFMKLVKHGWRSILLNPKFLIKKYRNIKFHFDSFHGFGNIDLAIGQLDRGDRDAFRSFVLERNCYNRSSMFLCKSKVLMNNYYETLFPWMSRCEKIFGFNNNTYGLKRIYGFLIERFQSYWFSRYTKALVWPIIFHDIRSNKIN